MTVDSMNAVSTRREQIAENHPTIQLRRRRHDPDSAVCKYLLADLDRAADAAGVGGAIEGGAYLILHNRRTDFTQPLEYHWQVFTHPLRRTASAFARDSHRTHPRKLAEIFRIRRPQIEHRGNVIRSQRFQCV